MSFTNFTLDVGSDGIALVTWNAPGRTMNVIDPTATQELSAIVEQTATDAAVKGIVVTSGKETFCAGADLTILETLSRTFAQVAASQGEEAANARFFEESRKWSLLCRRIETCGKPWAAAINGTAVGGGFELTLSCHYRVAADNPKTRLGLPEIKVGLFPGAGGTQRVARIMQPADALQFLLKGDQVSADRAKALKLIDAVVPAGDVIRAAKNWIAANPSAKAPWDVEGFKLPGGPVQSKAGVAVFTPANAIYRRETYDNYPAGRAIMQVVYEGLQLPMDQALRVESRYFAKILRSPEAAAMIRSLFVSLQEINKGARRPAAVPRKTFRKIGVLGAGFILARIEPTADYVALKDCDLVIEAVFEDRKIKEEVIGRAQNVIGEQTIFGSNTSTLPITSLAAAFKDRSRFIGIHFFSPVERMNLVEIILGKDTGEAALAGALDYVRAIRKTPIVVNDSRGFYTSRVVGTYLREGHLMLSEGVPAAMIENVGRMAGMPVGPLALNDEVAVDLAWKILKATEADLGADAVDARQKALLQEMVEKRGRLGRKNGKGFYDYPQAGPKRLWPGLADLQPQKLDPDTISVKELKQRFLVMQALETARCIEEGVVTDVREADVGSILGFGFAPFTGGTISYIDGMGTKAFVALCGDFAKRYGARFKPPKLLLDMAKKNETFYGRFPPTARKAVA
jgi:3-hydroxyacyl-CoA dehydrogenase/enoyl-CoA hydratase/3-hydroxybutyryl-CoA epimerase